MGKKSDTLYFRQSDDQKRLYLILANRETKCIGKI